MEIRVRAEALDEPTDPATGLDATIIRVHPRRVIRWRIEPEHLSLGRWNVT